MSYPSFLVNVIAPPYTSAVNGLHKDRHLFNRHADCGKLMERLLALTVLLCILLGCEPVKQQADQAHREVESAHVASNQPTQETPITGKVVSITDGDTIDILIDNRQQRIRLNGIDAPENGQPFGANAKQALSSMVFGKVVTIVDHGADRYNRVLGDVLVEGRSINLTLVANGLAWHYKQFNNDQQFATAEVRARAQRIGLWSDARSIAPWDWRKLSKAERDKLR